MLAQAGHLLPRSAGCTRGWREGAGARARRGRHSKLLLSTESGRGGSAWGGGWRPQAPSGAAGPRHGPCMGPGGHVGGRGGGSVARARAHLRPGAPSPGIHPPTWVDRYTDRDMS